LNLARTVGAEVTVYHVVDCNSLEEPFRSSSGNGWSEISSPEYGRLLKKARLDLARFLNHHFSDLVPWVKIREKVEIGLPEKNIPEWARRENPDLLVISTPATGDLSVDFFGTLAARIVVAVRCPVLCIHAAEEERLAQSAAG